MQARSSQFAFLKQKILVIVKNSIRSCARKGIQDRKSTSAICISEPEGPVWPRLPHAHALNANCDCITASTSVGSCRKVSKSGSPVGSISATPVSLQARNFTAETLDQNLWPKACVLPVWYSFHLDHASLHNCRLEQNLVL